MVAGLVPGQGMWERQPHIDVSLPLFLPPFPSLKSISMSLGEDKFLKTPKNLCSSD